jgi:hypothetical protein
MRRMDKLTPKNDKPLTPLYEFTQSGRVTAADVQVANERWKAERDGDEFQNILEAKAE